MVALPIQVTDQKIHETIKAMAPAAGKTIAATTEAIDTKDIVARIEKTKAKLTAHLEAKASLESPLSQPRS